MVNKKYIVCVDSDGCAMDTMNVKHIRFFGPLAADVFGIQNREVFLEEWNRVNLYSKTRGINRFKGLVMGLEFASEHGEKVGEIAPLVHWVKTTTALSNASLKEEIAKHPHESLEKALDWSLRVNVGIETELAGQDQPFEGVREALSAIHEVANVAIVSSANSEAINSEWNRHNLMPSVDVVYGQERGSKAAALAHIKENGFDATHILMVGDAPGDMEAARENETYFYPIIFGKEKESWLRLVNEVVPQFVSGQLTDKENEKYAEEFLAHLAAYE